jgi:uroporphyrin-III C-methyltransferase
MGDLSMHSEKENGAKEWKFPEGFVSIIGAGPGNPDLLTIRGLQRLSQAEVILYDALLDPDFLKLFPESALILYVGKRSGQHSATQDEINELIVKYALAGKRVVRLKGGDPFVFGRAGEEIQSLLENGIPFEIVPGVSSVQTGGAEGWIPLTHRAVSRQIFILDGHTAIRDGAEWDWIAKVKGTIVILMGIKNIQAIAKNLSAQGMESNLPLAIVMDAGLEKSEILYSTIGEVAKEGLTPKSKGPGIIYIGESVEMFRKARLEYINSKANNPANILLPSRQEIIS